MSDKAYAPANEHARRVHAMFAGIACRYDLLNHLLSGNIDKRWRRKVVASLAAVLDHPESIVLDVACGTGDLSLALTKGGRARVIGTDFCRPMLEIAAKKTDSAEKILPFAEADALKLPFADQVFDATTIAFGLRNLSSTKVGLSELYRVLKPGGRVVVLEFSDPVIPGFRQLFRLYFSWILPRIGGLLSGSRGAYEYLPASVSRFPGQKELASMMNAAGFCSVEYRNLTGGIAAIHSAIRPL